MPLTKEQITYIRNRINEEGIYEPQLLNDLLDHICCAVERELGNSSDFESAFNKVYNEFCPEAGLANIQEEIHIISHNKTNPMKKLLFISVLLISISFFTFFLLNGIKVSNNYDWTFINDLAFINQYAVCLFILPLYWFHQYKMAKNNSADGLGTGTKITMFTLGFLCSEALANALFFKLMQMPGGNGLFIITALLGMAYVPLFLFRKYRLEL